MSSELVNFDMIRYNTVSYLKVYSKTERKPAYCTASTRKKRKKNSNTERKAEDKFKESVNAVQRKITILFSPSFPILIAIFYVDPG